MAVHLVGAQLRTQHLQAFSVAAFVPTAQGCQRSRGSGIVAAAAAADGAAVAAAACAGDAAASATTAAPATTTAAAETAAAVDVLSGPERRHLVGESARALQMWQPVAFHHLRQYHGGHGVGVYGAPQVRIRSMVAVGQVGEEERRVAWVAVGGGQQKLVAGEIRGDAMRGMGGRAVGCCCCCCCCC